MTTIEIIGLHVIGLWIVALAYHYHFYFNQHDHDDNNTCDYYKDKHRDKF